VALAAAGWLLYTQAWGTGDAQAIGWRDLTHRMGKVEFTRRALGVYHSRGSFVRLLDATMPGRAPVPPKLDWNREQLVVISLGPRSSTGYSLRIDRVTEQRRGIYVYAREQTPALGDPVDARVTYVYRVLAMHGRAKPVYVKLRGR
jgi:PrcB C-terminal